MKSLTKLAIATLKCGSSNLLLQFRSSKFQNFNRMTKTHTHNGNDGQQPAKVHTYWTQSGRLFIYHMLKADGVLPIVERKENQ